MDEIDINIFKIVNIGWRSPPWDVNVKYHALCGSIADDCHHFGILQKIGGKKKGWWGESGAPKEGD